MYKTVKNVTFKTQIFAIFVKKNSKKESKELALNFY